MRRPRVSLWAAVIACLVLPLCRPAPAAAALPSVSLRAVPCVTEIVSVDALLDALRVEVRSRLGHLGAVTTSEEDAAFYVQLDCRAPDLIEVLLTRRSPPAASEVRVPLADVSPDARARTLALAIHEQLRALDATVTAPPGPPVPSPAQQRRLRLTGGLTIAFGALTVASTVIGAGLYGIAISGPAGNDVPELRVPGLSLLALGGAAFVGTGISLTFWLRERRRVGR